MKPKLLFLLRHGEPERRFHGRYVGRLDPSLSPAGREQAAAAARLVAAAGAERCFSSPLKRAFETAELAAVPSGLAVERTDLLLEADFGELEGKTFAEVAAVRPGFSDSWHSLATEFAFPGGETFAEFSGRVEQLTAFVRRLPEERLLLVAHGGILRGLLCRLLGIDPRDGLRFRFAYAGLASLELYGDGTAVLTGFNLTADSTA